MKQYTRPLNMMHITQSHPSYPKAKNLYLRAVEHDLEKTETIDIVHDQS